MERWRKNLYILWFGQVFCLMGFGFAVPFIPFLIQEMGVTNPTRLSYLVGLAFTLPAATMAIAAPIWGILSDRFGRRPMILRALISGAVLLVLMGFCREVWQFMTLRIIQGVMTGSVTAAMTFVSANTPLARQSYALGLMTASTFTGYSIGPFVGGILADLMGFRNCFITGGCLIFIGFLIVLFLLKEDPNTYGYRLKTDLPDSLTGRSVFMRVLNPFIVLLIVTLFFQKMARLVFMPFMALYAQAVLPDGGAATYTGLVNGTTMLATAIAAVTIVRLGDRQEKMGLVLRLTLLSLPLALALFFLPASALIAFIAIYTAYFLLAGAAEPILTAAASERTPPALRGTLFGMLGTVHSAAAMASPMVGGFISAHISIKAILLCMPAFTVVMLFCILILKAKSKKELNVEQGTKLIDE
ncbi:MAG TPA: multidrug efflux MFS transporter [Clostridiales bacterium]|jgi:DHA1 family multidrug resistance protein-like MFS transporter|nr:multidrug efflux MFS transporter [Clostridiales bacterium]